VKSNRTEAEAIGTLMIGLDCFFFVASAVGSFVAVHLLIRRFEAFPRRKSPQYRRRLKKRGSLKTVELLF
jgi:hypothetical protein